MAIEFARVRYVKRSDGGNACRSAAYNARSDVACSRTGERFFFAHRDPVLDHEILLPEGADAKFHDPTALWNAAQAMERRKDSQEARELLLALPSDPGLSLDDWNTMCREFVNEHFVSKGVGVQLDIHPPHEGEINVHAHVLVTTRRIEGDRFAAHKARDLDPEVRRLKGGRSVVTEGDAWGALWRDYQNRYFERQGLELRVDETGFQVQRHEGPVRMRTVPLAADERIEVTRAANEAAARDPAQVLAKITERRATFTELDIERLVRKHIFSPQERQGIRKAVLARPEVVALHDRETGSFANRFTTREVRAEERLVLEAAEAIATARKPVNQHRAQMAAEERGLDSEQKAAFLKATGTDGLVVIEGLAGTGKSHSLNAIRDAHERAGWRVVGLALMNVVADDLRGSGFRHASTAHREVWWQEHGGRDDIPKWDRRTVVMVDEAAMLDTHITARLMRQAALSGAKVIMAGDDRQLASVVRGGMFTELKERHGSVVISKVRRQEQDWQRTASESFAGGRIAEGLRAYAERGHVHWSEGIDESRARLLSDWDQDSSTHPGTNRFVYASTNVEVNRLNRAIHDIRLKRGEIKDELEVDTVKGKLVLGTGERIQFHGNDRQRGIYNGSLGTVTRIRGELVGVRTDTGRDVQFDAAQFNEFGLGYAGTVYRGQGKTQTDVYALYDNPFAWNARTAYVGLTRHKNRVELYVSQDLAPDEIALGRQMSRRTRDEASLNWATRAEIVELEKERGGRDGSGGGRSAGPGPAGARQAFPRQEAEALRLLDLPAYARDVHGYEVRPDPSGKPERFILTRESPDGGTDRLEARKAGDGHWTWRNQAGRRDYGDIFDLARREGAADLQAAREAVQAYDEAMRDPDKRRRAAEDKAKQKIERAAKQAAPDGQHVHDIAGAENEDRLEIAGAEHEDRLQIAGILEEQRQEFLRDEAARVQTLDQEAAQARDAEQRELHRLAEERPGGVDAVVSERAQQAAEARMAQSAQRRARGAAPGPELDAAASPAPETRAFGAQAVGVPTPAQLRYTEALARHYDPREPIASLARASLAEAAAYQRDRFDLDQRIAAQLDPGRRDALILRRDIEHAEHMTQVYDRLEFMGRATGGGRETDANKERADDFRDMATKGRREWRERGAEHPELYAPPAPEPRTLEQDRALMKRLDFPDYAAAKHGYDIQWGNDERTSARLFKDDDQLEATRSKDGAWSYESSTTSERGDILDFETNRGAGTLAKAREIVRPELERVERERELQPQAPEKEAPAPQMDRAGDAETPPVSRAPDERQEPAPERSPEAERAAMQCLDLPAYAAQRFGFTVQWRNDEHTLGVLNRTGEQLIVLKDDEGAWTYENRKVLSDHGDILNFESKRARGTIDQARDTIRPTLERVEQERGLRLDLERERLRELERDRDLER